MNNVDYELGLATIEEGDYYHTDEDWNSADGRGKAKIGLVACNTKCNARHPFNRTKRDECKGKCEAAYNAKIAYIDDSLGGDTIPQYAIKIDPPTNQTDSNQDTSGSGSDNRSSDGNGNGNGKKGLSTGAKIGIGVGVLVLIIATVVIVRKQKK